VAVLRRNPSGEAKPLHVHALQLFIPSFRPKSGANPSLDAGIMQQQNDSAL